ncbi:ABC transporter permease [Rhodovarius lipocyclicus]|uniref:ABC transporter permease n=1 Tax=Rhodovarius lipocyclicus TaxID=268410 RepID=UPI00135CE429|nr:ABC transporter permease [Rhodovarius lipocyclicus]
MRGRLSASGAVLVYGAGALILLFIMAPLLVVVSLSFSAAPFAVFPPRGFTLEWFGRVIADEEFQHAFIVSVSLAVAATAASFALGMPAAYALNRWKVPGAQVMEAILLSPQIFPILITGLALLQFMARAGLRDAEMNLFIGHVLITLPYLVRTITASLKLVDRSLEEAALTLGASPWRVFWLVTVPQIIPGIAAGCLFSFMISFDDFPISLWLADAQTVPLPIFLHSSMSRIFDPSIAAMSTLMILTGVLAVIGLEKLVGLRRAMGI